MSTLPLPSSLAHIAPVFPSLVLGDPNSPSLLVLLSGFPDDCRSAWGPTSGATSGAAGAAAGSGSGGTSVLDELARSHRVFSLCLPGFDDDGARRFDRWGYDFPALVRGMHATIEARLREESVARATFTLVCHDWGAAVGQLYENAHPERVAKLVMLDIGEIEMPPPIYHVIIILLYQWWFCVSFILSQTLGERVGKWHMLLFAWLCPNFLRVQAGALGDHRDPRCVAARMCYPYYQLWRAKLTRSANPKARFPTCPLLFMYGARKNAMFHGPTFLRRIEAHTAPSRWIELDCGHWLALAEPRRCIAEINAFCANRESGSQTQPSKKKQ